MARFVHLHNHSDYSLLKGAATIQSLVARAQEMGMEHLALTDDGNMFGALEFYQECKAAGINPIVGCDFYVATRSRHAKSTAEEGHRNWRLVLLAKNNQGYRNLIELASRAYTEGFYYKPRVDKELLQEFNDGLIALSGTLSAEVPSLIRRNRMEEAQEAALWYRETFGPENFYLELMDHGIADERVVNRGLTEIAEATGIPMVVANDCHYVHREDANAQDVLLCIGANRKKHETGRFRFSTPEFYMKSAEEMAELFPDHPEALENTLRIAEQCDLHIELPGPKFPDYTIPEGFESPDAYLKHLTMEGLAERYEPITDEIRERAEYELEVIVNMGYTGYFLIVWDFIKYARDHAIPVGPGRGSGAGSIVAYALHITDIDPLRFGLLFERFLNPERVSMPDFDIDFCYERRGEVIDYVTEKYGKERVGQIITFGTLKAKAVIRDVARVLDLPFSEADRIAKLVPAGPKVKLKDAIEQEPELKELSEQGGAYKELIEVSMKLEGLHRHASTHAAGIVIGQEPLTHYVPLYRDPRTEFISTQYTMELLEDCGLVKMDFLGLKTLTLIQSTEQLVRRHTPEFDIEEIPEDDPVTYRMLGEGRSAAVFQFEGGGMQGVLEKAKPTRIEDLIALNALYRPGPMENIDQFVESKHGRQEISYPLPELEPILKETYGVIVYQEQVMEIVQKVAGFSLGQADILRRAMGKKKIDVMNKMKEQFLQGAQERGYSEEQAQNIFELLLPFANYGFNKSHAAAYSVLAYKTAFLKANYPTEFMAANLTNEINNPNTFAWYMEEAQALGIPIDPPNVNNSDKNFTVSEGRIVFGLVGIKNVGSAAVEEIIRARRAEGPYSSFAEFLERVDLKTVNRKVVETLIQAGAFDSLEPNRNVLFTNVGTYIDIAAKNREARRYGQTSLFDGEDDSYKALQIENVEDWPYAERLAHEKELLGYYVSGHPLDPYREKWQKCVSVNLANTAGVSLERSYQLVGILKGVRLIYTKNGKPMAFATLEDFNGSIEIVFFEEPCTTYRDSLIDDTVVGLVGSLDMRNEKLQFVVEEVRDIAELEERDAAEVHIRLTPDGNGAEELYQLRAFLFERSGTSPVYLHIGCNGNAEYGAHNGKEAVGGGGADQGDAHEAPAAGAGNCAAAGNGYAAGETVIRASSQLCISSKDAVLEEIRRYPRVQAVWKT